MKSKTTVYETSLELLKNIVQDVFKGEDVTVILFGSRARGDNLETSDMDVGILPGKEMNKGKIALFRERIENSNIPYKVDVVDLSQTCLEMTDDRNLTSHTYIEKLAEQIYKKVGNYYKLMDSISDILKRNLENKEMG